MGTSRGFALGAGFLLVALASVDLGAQAPPPDPGSETDAVWVAVGGPGQILKLSSDDGTSLLGFDSPQVRAVAAGRDRVWTVGRSARVFDFAGLQHLEIALPQTQSIPKNTTTGSFATTTGTTTGTPRSRSIYAMAPLGSARGGRHFISTRMPSS